MNSIIKLISFIGLLLTLIPSILVFSGVTSLETSKIFMIIGTVIWFVSAPRWMNKTE